MLRVPPEPLFGVVLYFQNTNCIIGRRDDGGVTPEPLLRGQNTLIGLLITT